MFWKIRCVIAWAFRAIAVILSQVVTIMLARACLRAEEACYKVFPLGLAEIAVVGFGTFMAFELLGRLLSLTNPKGPLPRFRDRSGVTSSGGSP